MFGLFNKTPCLDETSSQWLLDTFSWAQKNFNSDLFYRHTVLVLPNNQFFPGKVDSVDRMANLIFDQVKQYAAISHWPTRIEDQNTCTITNQPEIKLSRAIRDPQGVADPSIDDSLRILIPYNPLQINKPEVMISSFAHILSHYMAKTTEELPPGGAEYWPHATELLAIFLGFGIMFANSAFTFRGGCGSCYNAQSNREAYLSELEATYALAIFTVLKEIPVSNVSKHLKKHLRSFFKKAIKEISEKNEEKQPGIDHDQS